MKTKDFLRKHKACYDGAKWALSISDEKWLGYGLYRKPKWIATKCAQKNQRTKFINELEKVI